MKLSKIILIVLIITVPIAIIYGLLHNKKILDENKVPVDRSKMAINVNVDTVSYKPFDGAFYIPANIIPNEDAIVSSETSGILASLNIQLGTYVKKNQVIGTIDTSELKLKLEAVQLSISKLKSDLERNKALVAGNATNATTITDTKYELDSKQIEAKQLKNQIAKANVLAPISGTVVSKNNVAGEYVNMGNEIAKITNTSVFKAQVFVPENQIFKIKKGDIVRLSAPNTTNDSFNGKVTYISPKGDDSHNYLVELVIMNVKSFQLKAGLYVNVEFNSLKKQNLMMIPKSALVEGTKNPYVYKLEKGMSVYTKLKTGLETEKYIEVTEGLKAGDIIITSGQINLSNGSNVKVVQTK